MTDKVQKIREEVERLKATYDIDLPHGIGAYTTCETILSFIDSMQEEPVSEELEEAAKKAATQTIGGVEKFFWNDYHKFKAGAEWQKEQIEKVLLSEVLPCFMHGGEADEVVAKLDEVLNQKK